MSVSKSSRKFKRIRENSSLHVDDNVSFANMIENTASIRVLSTHPGCDSSKSSSCQYKLSDSWNDKLAFALILI